MFVQTVATTCERLKEAMQQAGLKQVDLVKKTGIDKSSISLYISGKVTPKGDKLYKLSVALGVSPTWLSGFDVPMQQDVVDERILDIVNEIDTDIIENCNGNLLVAMEKQNIRNLINIKNIIPLPETKTVPLVGTIACGTPILAEENIEDYIKIDATVPADFALRCKGDSMINSRIYDGDIVYIRKQSDVDDGEIAAVLIDNEATLKKVYKYPNKIVLRASNPVYDDMIYTNEELENISILGKAVAFFSLVR